jgi:hypothetical protein
MAIIAKKGEGKEFFLIPEDSYVARCIYVVDIGTHITTGKFAGKKQNKVCIGFELPEVMNEFTE